MKILQDIDEDSEIRIAAYKVLMECPSNKVLGVVRNTLAKEEVNQVSDVHFYDTFNVFKIFGLITVSTCRICHIYGIF
jgi:hypothetical protein